MKLQALAWWMASLLLPAAPAIASGIAPAVPSEPEQFQVTEKTEVPNVTLQPGSYSIRIVDHLKDRVILQVSGKNHVQVTFLAVPAATMATSPVGPIAYGAGPKGKAALKGFSFPGGTAVEFVYPKNDAVSIAQANGTRVMAIDPASEGRVPAPKLSPDDMQMVTLWMLEPARVGPGDAKPSIAASRYQAPPPAEPVAPVQTAQAQPVAPPAAVPAPAPAPAAQASVQPEPASSVASLSAPAPAAAAPTPSEDTSSHATSRHQRQVEVARNDVPPAPQPARTHTRPAGIKALPHTASFLPILWLGAALSLGLACVLSLRRLTLAR